MGRKSAKSGLKFFFAVLLSLSTACTQEQYALKKVESENIAIDSSLRADSSLARLVAPYRQELAKTMNRPLAQNERALEVGLWESPLGNFIADITRLQAQHLSAKTIDIGLTTEGGIRVPLPAGTIQVRDLFELSPFENRLVAVELRGSDLQALFAYHARTGKACFSGCRMTIREGKVGKVRVGGKPIDKDRVYHIATSDYLANGGDGMDFMERKVAQQDLGMGFRQALIAYLERQYGPDKTLDYHSEDRVKKTEQP